jgi:CheY-like chemotaxis protein
MQFKVLVVDDDPILVISLKLHFSDIGILFESAGDGQEALKKLETFEPDIILSDIIMPRIDGYELRKQLRQNPDTAGIPFIFLSAKCDISDQVKAYRLGIDDYVCKPFQMDDLVQRMKRALSHAQKIKSFQMKADFSGDQSQMAWTDMLQIMELNHKSGVLVLRKPSGVQTGKVLFKDGRLINAQAASLKGEEAFFALMTTEKGSFEFSDKAIKADPKITSSNKSLLLQGSQMMDHYKELLALITDLNVTLEFNSRKDIDEIGENDPDQLTMPIISQIQEGLRVREILDSGIMSPIRAASILLKLLKSNRLRIRCQKTSCTEQTIQTFSTYLNAGSPKIVRRIEQRMLTGVLEYQNRRHVQAVFFQNGQIVHACHGKTIGKKALFRIFREQGGILKFIRQPISISPTFESAISLHKILQECFNETKLLAEIDPAFWTKSIIVNHKKAQKLLRNKNSLGLRYFIAMAEQHTVVSEIIDFSKFTDSKTCEQLLYLLNTGILQIRE